MKATLSQQMRREPGLMIELTDGRQAIIWTDEPPINDHYNAYVMRYNAETTEQTLINKDSKPKILKILHV